MAESIIMPKTGMAMEEGVIVEWLVKEGDIVSTGDPVVEIETDKSSMEVESDYDGTILKILYENGDTVPVVQTIAWIGKPGEKIPESSSEGFGELQDISKPGLQDLEAKPAETKIPNESSLVSDGKIKATPAARRVASERALPLESITPSGRSGEIREADVLSFKQVKTTALAGRVAQDQGLDLSGIQGSGHNGKIFSSDLNTNVSQEQQGVSMAEDRRVPLTNIQKITGRRLLQSHTEIPVVTSHIQADVSEMLKIRKQINKALNGEVKITINDFVLKACALALEENPRVNSVLDGNDLIYKGNINLSMAVATGKGLLVPVIQNANRLSLKQLSSAAADLAKRGREGKIKSEEMEGGTFTISNIGTFGISGFTPIINQPQAAILGVCAIDEKLKLVDGAVCVSNIMGLSLTFDHRVLDGAESSIFLSRIRELLETPLALMV